MGVYRASSIDRSWIKHLLCVSKTELQMVLFIKWHFGVRVSKVRQSGVLRGLLGHQV